MNYEPFAFQRGRYGKSQVRKNRNRYHMLESFISHLMHICNVYLLTLSCDDTNTYCGYVAADINSIRPETIPVCSQSVINLIVS